uniref:NACHT domain-containing protein n=2 Tax=unclassified Psychrobacter TaxID=196806 RepID=UPI0039AFA0F5
PSFYSQCSTRPSLADKYPNLIIVVSSRPEYNLFSDWSLYNVARIQPLILSQAVDVIKKLDYDSEVRARFILALETTLFSKHESFSSNPLLLTIMLVTYEQFGDIPDRVYIFYDLAYHALFNKHDVSKQGFLRKSSTNLDMYELRDIFALFSLFTYSKQMFEMTEDEIHTFLKKCLVHSKSEVIDKDLKLELLNNVPLLMRDGLNYCFTHRSFQEYFTAYYIVNHVVKEQVFERVCGRYHTDNVVDMAFSMNKEVLEDKWILPKINKILDLKPVDTSTINRKIQLISVFFNRIDEIRDRGKKEIGFTYNENSYFLNYLVQKYGCQYHRDYLNDKYHSHDFTYEETDFFELVLNDKQAIMLEELNDFEKNLVCRMGSERHGELSFELIEYIKSLILTNRNDSLDDIENFIFD